MVVKQILFCILQQCTWLGLSKCVNLEKYSSAGGLGVDFGAPL